MLPVLFTVGGVPVYTYTVLVVLALVVGVATIQGRARSQGVDPEHLPGLYVAAIAVGHVGAWVMHVVGSDPAAVWADPLGAFDPRAAGVAFLGGVLGGTAAGAVVCWLRGLPFLRVADLVAPGVMLGLSVGRLGCFAGGCCHGAPVAAPVGGVLWSLSGGDVVWTHGLPGIALVANGLGATATTGVPLYPTQLLASALALLLGASLLRLSTVQRFDGQVMAAMLGAYGVVRLGLEQLRGDAIRGDGHTLLGTAWSTGELSSALLLGLAVALWLWARARPRAPLVVAEAADVGAVELDLPE